MKRILLAALLLSCSVVCWYSCNDESSSLYKDIPIFSNYADITNPPDKFILYIPLKSYVESRATIIFDSLNVWKIYRITGQSNSFRIERHDSDSTRHFFITQDTLRIGMRGGISYYFYSSFPADDQIKKFLVMFEKLPDPYTPFIPKF
jgi:hypothetical protein